MQSVQLAASEVWVTLIFDVIMYLFRNELKQKKVDDRMYRKASQRCGLLGVRRGPRPLLGDSYEMHQLCHLRFQRLSVAGVFDIPLESGQGR